MAAPTRSNVLTATYTADTTPTIALDTGTADKVAVVSVAGQNTVTWPGDWTEIVEYQGTSGTGEECTYSAAYKLNTSDTTVEPTLGSGTGGRYVSYFVDGGDFSGIVVGTGAPGTSSTPDQPASGTLASGDWLVFAGGAFGRQNGRTITSPPTNYTLDGGDSAGNTQASLGNAWRGLTGITSEDPGTWTLSGIMRSSLITWAIPASDTAVHGDGASDWEFGAAGTGSVDFDGDGASSWEFGVVGDGTFTQHGDGASDWEFSLAGVGNTAVIGDGTSDWEFGVAGAGTFTQRGDGASDWELGVAGAGTFIQHGTASLLFGFQALGDGTFTQHADATSDWEFAIASVAAVVSSGAVDFGWLVEGAGTFSAPVIGNGSGSFGWRMLAKGRMLMRMTTRLEGYSIYNTQGRRPLFEKGQRYGR